MPTTSNFGWTTPADTDLVKDGASAIRTLGNGIDTSFVDLKGGTTGQVLAKASNTDLDFTWASDATGIPATIFDAKGDIIAATAADTASRLAVGSNGQVLTADSTASTGLKWASPAMGSYTYTRIGSTSGTATSLTYTITTGYKQLYIAFNVTDPGSMYLRLNSLSGSNYQNSYYHRLFSVNNTTATSITLDGAVTINSGGYWNGIVQISDVTGNKPFVEWNCVTNGNGSVTTIGGIANYNSNITLSTLQFVWTNSRAYELVEWGAN